MELLSPKTADSYPRPIEWNSFLRPGPSLSFTMLPASKPLKLYWFHFLKCFTLCIWINLCFKPCSRSRFSWNPVYFNKHLLIWLREKVPALMANTIGLLSHSHSQTFLYSPTLTSIHDYWKNHSFDKMDLCWQEMSLLFNMLPRLVKKAECRRIDAFEL